MKTISDETELHQIKYIFSDVEKHQFAIQLADTCQLKHKTENEKKEAASSFKAKLDSQDGHISHLSTKIAQGFEFRSQPCIVKKDFKKGIKQYYYEGVLYDTVLLTPEDTQLRLDADESDKNDLDFLK